jgi:hypothetical protein
MKHLLKEEVDKEGVEFLDYEQMEALDNSRTYFENILQGKTSKVRVGSWEEAEMIERQEDHFFCLQWEQWKTYYMNKYENINDLTGKYL